MAVTRRTRRLQARLDRQIRRITDQAERDLARAYARAWDEISTDLTKVLTDMLVLAGEDITLSQLLASTRLRRALQHVGERLTSLTAAAGIRITQDLQAVIDTAGGAQASIIDSQLPPKSQLVDLQSWAQVDTRAVDAIVTRTTQQITSRLRPLSADAEEAMRRELARGVAAGSHPNLVARRMVARTRKPFAGGLSRATTIARTEILDAHRAAAKLGQEQHSDVLAGWRWMATLTSRTCPACLSKHGRLYDLSAPGPLGHQRCRCARVPEPKPWSDLGFDIDEPPSLFPDADTFFAGLTPGEQQAILGRRGYQAWLAGKWPREKWARRRETRGWRPSYVVARPPKTDAA